MDWERPCAGESPSSGLNNRSDPGPDVSPYFRHHMELGVIVVYFVDQGLLFL